MRAFRIAVLGALLASCAPPLAREAETVDGTVVDALSGAPLAGARVTLAGAADLTDARGRFSLPRADGSLSAVAPDHLGLRRLELDADPVLPLWPREPDEAAVDAYLRRIDARRALRDDPDDPALRPAARAWLRGESPPAIDGDVGATRAALDAPPASIRIWRRSIDGATDSCAGRIDEIPFEDYVAGVLPHEWIPSWDDESLMAGALTIRTYAWGWVRRGGKYDCADLDDTARSQVYRDDRTERATAAVFATTGMAITVGGELVSGEYSAENGNPTAFGVVDPLCDGHAISGHGRGMCQWGSQRWALDGQDHLWIAAHYFPDSIVEGGTPSASDYDSALVAVEAPGGLVSGERAQVTVQLTNTGAREWTAEGTRLATADAEPSPFFDDVSWIDAATATAPDAFRYAPGETGAFTFWVTAPEVTTEQDVIDELRLSHEGVGGFGELLTLSIRISPRSGGVELPDAGGGDGDAGVIDDDAGTGSGGGLTGCGVAPSGSSAPLWLAALLGLLWRRRG